MAADNTNQRRNNASSAVVQATALLDAIYALQKLADERAKFIAPFLDSDFVGTANPQLSAALMGQLYDFIMPSVQTWLADVGNGGRNVQTLQQVRV